MKSHRDEFHDTDRTASQHLQFAETPPQLADALKVGNRTSLPFCKAANASGNTNGE
jgi:hypothetical protein